MEKGGILVIPPLLTHSSIYSNAHNSRMVINCSMSFFPPEHLSRTFKQKTNMHFNEYVLSYRLKQAEI